MDELQATVRIKVHEGTLADFEGVAREMVRIAREVDTGTLQFDWFSSADDTEYVVRATYRDSNAAIEHIANLKTTLKTFQAMCSVDMHLFGNPSDKLREAGAKLGVKVYAPFLTL